MKRNLQLDFLRFCGVFLVMISHIIIYNHSRLDGPLSIIAAGGGIGVDLFFVLSGYLVSGLIFNELNLHSSFNGTNFLIRRGFKIYPVYYIFLIVFWVFSVLTNYPHTYTGLWHEAVFISNYTTHNSGHLWSLCVEEHFYFLLTLVFFILIKLKRVEFKSFVAIYLFLLVAGLAFRTYNYLHYSDYDFYRDYSRSHYRFDGLFFGVLLAYAAHYKKETLNKLLGNKFSPLLIILSLLFLLSNFVFHRDTNRWVEVTNVAVNPICFGFLMLHLIRYNNTLFLKIITPLSYIGKYSYSIYLFHVFFSYIAIMIAPSGGVKYYLLYFLLSLAGGIIISKGIEYPLINIREKYFPSRSVKLHRFKPADKSRISKTSVTQL